MTLFQRMLQAYINFWKKAFTMSGRANRLEYWVPVIVHLVVTRLIGMSSSQFMTPDTKHVVPFTWTEGILLSISIILFVPTMMLFARRLHDIEFDGKLTYFFFFFQGLLILSTILYYFYSVEEVTKMLTPPLYYMLGIMTMLVNLAQFVLALWPGSKGVNKYGEPSHSKAIVD